jgi:hypothetical protein
MPWRVTPHAADHTTASHPPRLSRSCVPEVTLVDPSGARPRAKGRYQAADMWNLSLTVAEIPHISAKPCRRVRIVPICCEPGFL